MKPTIQYSDFEQLDLRVGRIIAATAPEWSEKLLEFTVDFGAEIGQKTIFSGIRKWYQSEFFVNNCYIFVVNLAERKMGPGVSQGMMLMVDTPEQPLVFAAAVGALPGAMIR